MTPWNEQQLGILLGVPSRLLACPGRRPYLQSTVDRCSRYRACITPQTMVVTSTLLLHALRLLGSIPVTMLTILAAGQLVDISTNINPRMDSLTWLSYRRATAEFDRQTSIQTEMESVPQSQDSDSSCPYTSYPGRPYRTRSC